MLQKMSLRVPKAWGGVPYLILDGTMDECITLYRNLSALGSPDRWLLQRGSLQSLAKDEMNRLDRRASTASRE